jgi:hypothetical protein
MTMASFVKISLVMGSLALPGLAVAQPVSDAPPAASDKDKTAAPPAATANKPAPGPAAAAVPAPAPAPTGTAAAANAGNILVEKTNSGQKLFRITEGLVVEGQRQKPNAFYVLQRASTPYDWETLEENFLPRILKAAAKPPF